MKHAHLVLDENLLEEAVKLTGERTFSGAVNVILADYVRRARARRILELRGSGAWEGDLGEMRRDGPVPELSSGSRSSGGRPRVPR